MYVCICTPVTDSTIRDAVAKGNTNWKTLCKDLHIAQQCGKCGNCARALYQDILSKQQKPSSCCQK